MNEKEYNAAEGIRRSDLWWMNGTPEKFRWHMDNPDTEKSPALMFGSACHKWVLEKDDFGSEYAVAPQVDKRTKEGKAVWEQFCAENEGKAVVGQDDFNTMQAMRDALNSNRLAKKLMFGKGETEQTFFWTDAETGEKCKIKTDRIVKYNRRWYVVDYKTCQCAETNRFNSEIWKFGYYFQAGMYTDGVMHGKKLRKRPGFLIVAQEKKAPYSVNVIEISEEVMNAGVAKFRELIGKYHDCAVLDNWPGYMTGDVPNDSFVPTWMEREMEDDIL